MKKLTLLLVIAVVVCGCLIGLWTLPFFLPARVRTPGIDLGQLLVDTSDFPSNWKLSMSAEPYPKGSEHDWGEENLNVVFEPLQYQGVASHSVFRFRNELAAQYGLSRIQAQGFIVSWDEPLVTLPQWHYASQGADDWLMACHPLNDGGSSCTVVARYDEYISAFSATLNDRYLKLDGFEHLLAVIDEKMSQFLK
jgi:hypothetical protein